MNTTRLPTAVGNLSERVRSLLSTGRRAAVPTLELPDDPFDHDAQLALYMLNELHFAGWVHVDDTWEWDPRAIQWKLALSDWFEQRLRHAVGTDRATPVAEARRLLDLEGPSVSRHLAEVGTVEQVVTSMIGRSPYQGKEADPHTFVVPRMTGAVKRTLCEIQAGEYGVGHARSHAELFADALAGLGLDPTPNAHINQCGGLGLAVSNLVSLGGLQRRLRGVVLGQLALFEMDSVVPNTRMVQCCDRLGLADSVRPFFHVHVLADAEHEVMAEQAFLVDYPQAEPDQIDNLLLGMRAQSLIDQRVAASLVPSWESDGDVSALRHAS